MEKKLQRKMERVGVIMMQILVKVQTLLEVDTTDIYVYMEKLQ
jgi:hypothetical protein